LEKKFKKRLFTDFFSEVLIFYHVPIHLLVKV
jgi:hypothetical protein